MRRFFSLIIFPIILFGCSEKNPELKTPDYVIPQDKMINILVDMHIADGALSTLALNKEDTLYSPPTFYRQVFKKYDVSKHDVDTSIFFYAQHAEYYNLMYDTVLARLSKMIGDETQQNKVVEDSADFNNQ